MGQEVADMVGAWRFVLKEYLRKRRLTQVEAARQLGVHLTTLNGWLRGRVAPRRHMALRVEEWSQGEVPASLAVIADLEAWRRSVQGYLDRYGYTHADLARAIGVSQQAVSKWFTTGQPSQEHLEAIAEFMEGP